MAAFVHIPVICGKTTKRNWQVALKTPQILRHKRLLYNTISDSTLDAQGRISLTPAQMSIAGISKEVTLIGQANYVEVWDTAKYETYLGGADDFDEVFFQSVETGLAKR